MISREKYYHQSRHEHTLFTHKHMFVYISFGFSLLDDGLTVPMLVDLMKKHGPSVQAACLGVMQNVSTNNAFHRRLLEQGVLEALDAAKDVDGGALSAQCAAVLYNFSLFEQSLTHMVDLGAIFLATHLSYSNVIKVRCHLWVVRLLALLSGVLLLYSNTVNLIYSFILISSPFFVLM